MINTSDKMVYKKIPQTENQTAFCDTKSQSDKISIDLVQQNSIYWSNIKWKNLQFK